MGASIDDGYIKYTSTRRDGEVAPSAELNDLNRARTTLFDLGLIGVYDNGVGYGNLSIRANDDNQFVITASATGALRTLQADQFCLVEAFSVDDNHVQSMGSLPASSESMTHGAIYAAHPDVRCVIHVHSRMLFEHLLHSGAPATPADVPYGTPAMAHTVAQLVARQPNLPTVFVMAGHMDGVVAYGADTASTLDALCALLQRISTP
ncbi:MAG: class II aldolase/adducin family protein [Burkholderiales bacterium]|nr:class II aldolase/adducin family protein [Burkholderiales bacterium]